jgi:Kelch motif protein
MLRRDDFSAPVPWSAALLLTAICTGALLRPVNAQTWTQAAPPTSPSARSNHAMAYDTALAQTVLFGGGGNSGLLNDTWVWDGTNWTQESPGTVPSPRSQHAMAYDSADGKVVLFGGSNGSSLFNDTWVWDGNNWTQEHPVTSPPVRSGHAMAYDSLHGQVVLFGGGNGSGFLGDTWVWNGTNWMQKSPGTSPTARAAYAMAYDSTHQQVVLFGGISSSGTLNNDTWVWDGSNWTKKSPSANPPLSQGQAMAFDSLHGQAILFGGSDQTWAWDGTNWNPEVTPTSLSGRSGLGMVFDSSHDQTVLFGGLDGSTFLGDTWLWCHNSFDYWAQAVPSISPPARYSDGIAYDALHQQVVVFAGRGSAGTLDDTWVWDGSNWTLKSPGSSPSARQAFAMAYDSLHAQTVVFGGNVGTGGATSFGADTWVWDGTDWTQKFPATSPPGREFHAMAFDSAHGQVVLFGGLGSSGYIADTWVWDGSNWTQKFPSTNPPARADSAIAYDAAQGQVVLFGGQTNSGASADTWVWDGTSWTQKFPATSPPAREDHSLAYDSAHAQVVLFGGSPNFNDTWGWDGTNWTQQPSNTNPYPRSEQGMAYDAVHGQMVVFGGPAPGSDTWLWQGGFSVSPNSGSGAGPQVFGATYFDNNGVSDLQVVYLDFGATGDSPHDCKVAFAPGGNTLFLFNDANTGVVGSIILGGGGSISNSQCTLFGGNTPALISGDQLTVPFDIQFLAGYGGRKNIFAVAQDFSGVQSNNGIFQVLGSWIPAPSTPGVVSVTPNSGRGQGPLTFTAVYSDTAGANDLEVVYLDFGSVGFAAHNCIVVYVPGPNQLYLFTDDNSNVFGPISEGAGSGSISNSQCKLFSGSTPATLSGNNLSVPFVIQFLAGYGGLKQIFGLAQTYAGTQSQGGLLSTIGSWEPATTTPSAVSVSPNSGTGLSQVFTANYSDTGGANDLQVVYLSFGSSFNAAHSCNVGYEPGNNTLFLLGDNNSTIATVGEGGGGSVSNSQCTLSGGSTAATQLGTGVTVPFTITFKSGFTGSKTMFGLAQTYDGTQSAITTLGSWTP